MRSRILHYKKNLIDYDILTQFSVGNVKKLPDFDFYEAQLKSTSFNEVKNICLNLVAIQLLGNSYIDCASCLSTTNFKLRVTNKTKYFLLENIFLLSYKNVFKKFNYFKVIKSSNITTISCHDFLSVVEYFSVNSNFMKLMEKVKDKNLLIKMSYKIKIVDKKSINFYFLKSLGYPF
uniref:Uncharacterized protein n=1 Tax=Porphyra umbilicalis TaxID=2786 RepID=J3RY70_PORUM|nr:hypothetical protein C320_mgp09 [Porphyra umbilicalis]AFC17790.1 hypothetical protein [Porphyra umbilicalis]